MNPMKDRPGRKPDLHYPCAWGYKVIGSDAERLRAAIAEVIQELPHTVQISNKSLTGKYICLELELIVPDEECRLGIYDRLRRHPAIKIVL